MIYKLKLLVLFLMFPTALFSQTKFEKKGDKAILKGDYPEAIIQFKNIKDKNAEVNRKIAECYFVLGRYDQSENFYNSIQEKEKNSADLLHLSQINLANDNFTAAVLLAERAGELGADPNEVQIRLDAVCKFAEVRKANQDLKITKIKVQPQGKCLGIFLLPEGIVYSEAGAGKLKSDKNYKLLLAAGENSEFNETKSFAGKLEPKTDIGAICISPDGNTMYYTRWCIRKGKQQMEIAIAEKKNGEWRSKESLAFCSRKYSCCYPFLSPDGKTMYFSSDMEGGYGGMDLYVSKQENGKWTEPQNLGKSINTAQNEIYPRVLSNNQLWFSSDGHAGYGKLDLFFTSRNEDGSWAPVLNPGEPYNSAFSEYSIQDIPETGMQLFVSDREDRGLRDRIYELKKEDKKRVQVFVKDAHSYDIIKNVKFSVLKALENKVIVADKGMIEGETSFEIPESEFDQGILYEITVQKTGYMDRKIEYYPSSQKMNIEVSLDRISEKPKFSFVSELTPIAYPKKKIAFKNIYFEKNEDDFSDEAKKILDRLYRFWKEFPELGIKINGHSDSKGLEQMNLDISLQKAEKAKEYLVKKGMDVSEIEVGAWGGEFILNGCFDDSGCSENEHHENRRIELIFVL
ncbi:OmpA family protein [Labilibaculum manganireducens]|uniref:OmpA family protein n=1 Tax=Labilibaculum manganireducens TaxID=1940525 RepID=UPI0029F4E80C|nr:OmpA family protein [Labilibaculum manganireducens]